VEGEVAKSTAMAAEGEDRRTQWRARLGRFARDGGSVAQFCAAEAVSKWAFYYWRRRLAAPALPRTAVLAKPRVLSAGAAGFIEVGAGRLGASQPRAVMAQPLASAGVELRIELGGGVVVQVMRR
jgi:hypothetical protein